MGKKTDCYADISRSIDRRADSSCGTPNRVLLVDRIGALDWTAPAW
jgi:hypothetical protein